MGAGIVPYQCCSFDVLPLGHPLEVLGHVVYCAAEGNLLPIFKLPAHALKPSEAFFDPFSFGSLEKVLQLLFVHIRVLQGFYSCQFLELVQVHCFQLNNRVLVERNKFHVRVCGLVSVGYGLQLLL